MSTREWEEEVGGQGGEEEGEGEMEVEGEKEGEGDKEGRAENNSRPSAIFWTNSEVDRPTSQLRGHSGLALAFYSLASCKARSLEQRACAYACGRSRGRRVGAKWRVRPKCV